MVRRMTEEEEDGAAAVAAAVGLNDLRPLNDISDRDVRKSVVVKKNQTETKDDRNLLRKIKAAKMLE
jgi:hypothetical protein